MVVRVTTVNSSMWRRERAMAVTTMTAALERFQALLQAFQHVRLQCGADLLQDVDELAADIGLSLPRSDLAVDVSHLADHAAQRVEVADARGLDREVALTPVTPAF